MKFELDIPKAKAANLILIISKWESASPKPLTNFVMLKELETKIATELTHILLASNQLSVLKEKLAEESTTLPPKETKEKDNANSIST